MKRCLYSFYQEATRYYTQKVVCLFLDCYSGPNVLQFLKYPSFNVLALPIDASQDGGIARLLRTIPDLAADGGAEEEVPSILQAGQASKPGVVPG